MAIPFDYGAMGRRLRDLRVQSGMTQEQLSEAAGISTSFVGHIERGEKKCSMETVYNLVVCLGASLDYVALGKRNQCNQQSCALYVDLRELVDSYGEEQRYAPRILKGD